MKTLFKNLPVALLALTLAVGCGKDNASGGGSSVKNTIGSGGFTDQPMNQTTIEQVRESFNQRSMADGTFNGMQFYHRVAQSSGVNVSFNTYGCLDLLLFEVGDCGSDSHISSYVNQVRQTINGGKLYTVKSASSSSANVDRLVDVSDSGQLSYNNETISKSSGLHQMMVAGTSNTTQTNPYYNYSNVYVQKVRITVSRTGNQQSQTIDGVYVRNEHGEFVVSVNVPLAANPIYYNTSSGSGYLDYYTTGNASSNGQIPYVKVHGFN